MLMCGWLTVLELEEMYILGGGGGGGGQWVKQHEWAKEQSSGLQPIHHTIYSISAGQSGVSEGS